MIATDEAPATGKLVGSREDPDPAHTPRLIVNYSVASTPPPAQPVLFATALVGNGIRFSFNAESNRTYAVEFRNSLTSGTWNVLTNIAAQPVASTIHITNVISSTERYFRARTP